MAKLTISKVNAPSKTAECPVTSQYVHPCLCRGWTTTTMGSSTSVTGGRSIIITKSWDPLQARPMGFFRQNGEEILLRQVTIQSSVLCDKHLEKRWDLSCLDAGPRRGTSSICSSPRFLSWPDECSSSFGFLIKVACWQMGQIMLSLRFPSVLMLSSVLTRQSWQNTCWQLRVRSRPDRLS